MRRALSMLLSAALLLAAGCGRGTTQEIAAKVEAAKVKTKADLESVLGKPDKFEKLGPIESWTYTTADGEYSIKILGNDVVFGSGAGGEKKRK
jgi:hypothetical protein